MVINIDQFDSIGIDFIRRFSNVVVVYSLARAIDFHYGDGEWFIAPPPFICNACFEYSLMYLWSLPYKMIDEMFLDIHIMSSAFNRILVVRLNNNNQSWVKTILRIDSCIIDYYRSR